MIPRFTIEYIREYVESSCEYKLLSNFYKNASTPLEVKCLKCGNVFTTNYRRLYNGAWCIECSTKRSDSKKLSPEYVKNYIEKDKLYELRSEYIAYNSKMVIYCKVCNKEFLMHWNSFHQGCRCPHCYLNNCGSNLRLDINYIRDYMLEEGYELLSEKYENNQHPLSLKCLECNHIWNMNWNNFKSGKRCPQCFIMSNMSKGERKINKILTELNIEFEMEKRFEDCRHIYPLPFDFFLPKYNTCIEYDGKLHYHSDEYFGGDVALQETQTRDNIKNLYCQDKGINLIRIPYWEFENIRTIITTHLI